MMKSETVNVSVNADTQGFDTAMAALTDATRDFGRVFTSTISQSIKSGKSFEQTLRSIGQRFVDLALNQAIKPVEGLFENFLGNIAGSFGGGSSAGIPGFANGGVFGQQGAVPFARGGVVSSPTAFGFGNRLGVMGEAGPEAIMPLARGSDGRLGVASTGAPLGGGVVINVQATDAHSFRKSEGQITAMLARAVSRGQRGL